MNEYYTYMLIHKTDQSLILYIGKGKGDRMYQHRKDLLNGKHTNKTLSTAVYQMWMNEEDFVEVKLAEGLTDEEALKAEVELIKKYSRKLLCNGTDGGDGASGAIRSLETRKKISDAWKYRTKETENRRSIAIKNSDKAKEQREILHRNHKPPVFTVEDRKKGMEIWQKKVIRMSDGKIYISVKAASVDNKCCEVTIIRNCKGRGNKTGTNQKFKYLTEVKT